MKFIKECFIRSNKDLYDYYYVKSKNVTKPFTFSIYLNYDKEKSTRDKFYLRDGRVTMYFSSCLDVDLESVYKTSMLYRDSYKKYSNELLVTSLTFIGINFNMINNDIVYLKTVEPLLLYN